MFNGNAGVSLADIAAVTRNNDNNGFGNGGDWWAWIILFALFGWGNGNGFGFGGNGNNFEGTLQRGFDTQTIISKLDGLNSGVCSLGYDQLAQQNQTNNLITQTGYSIERAAQQNAIAAMQNQFALSQQIGDCCCKNERMLADLKYDMATSDCAIKTLMNQLFQQLQWGQQAGLRDLTDLIQREFCNLRMEQKDAVIAELQAKLNNCDRDTALQSMATYLINTLSPRAVPAYPACNPNGVGNWSANVLSQNGFGYNNGGCCGNSGGCCA